MKNYYSSKALGLLFFLIATKVGAQNIAINTSGATPVNTSVLLDLSNNLTNGTTGFLAPYAALTATNSGGPIAAPSPGLIVYNTATAGASPTNVIPGYYYWDGAKWQLLMTGSGSTTLAWSILGNTGTNPLNNFVGTSDPQDLVLKTNSTEGLRITSVVGPAHPRIGINDAVPAAIGSAMVEIKGTDASQYGPHVQYLTAADAYPVSQILNWSHDNISINFDSYWDGPASQWRSSSTSTPAYQVLKYTAKFWIRYAAALPVGTGPENWLPGFVMTGTGLIGMGTSTPEENLTVNAGLNIDELNLDNGTLLAAPNYGLTFGIASGEGIGSQRTAGAKQHGLDFYTASAERMTMLNGGNIGISNTAPTTLVQIGNAATATGKLSVYSQDFQFGQIQIGNPTANSEASMQFISGVSAFGSAATSSGGSAYSWNIGAGTYLLGGTKFVISNVAAGAIMTFTSAGLVGIGATGPNRELEIGGNVNTVRIDGITSAGTFYSATTPATATSSIMFANNANGDIQALAPSATNGQVLTQTATGPAWQAMGDLNNVVVILSSGTYTPSAGTKGILVKLVGGGGGGGGVAATVHALTEDALAAGGGGAGGYCEYYVANVAASYPVTVGIAGTGGLAGNNAGTVGGSTTFSGVTASGGSGGSGCAAATGVFFNSGGAGGAAAGGTVNIPGVGGGNGVVLVNSAASATIAGVGGSGPLGQGGPSPYVINSTIAGTNGIGYGAGGSGADSNWASGGNNGAIFGGNGAPGVIIVYEYK
ncbi:MAG TPA: hypothetical protein VK809_02280 [Bacteroidia bacterium]|nr:hypothetical protein [Bacteroidia bacterium]